MMPVGYMTKRVSTKPDWLNAPLVKDIHSVSSCVSEDFTDNLFIGRNGYWFFDTPEAVRDTALEMSLPLRKTSLFYYEAYEVEFDGKRWRTYGPVLGIDTKVVPPRTKRLNGYDVVTFSSEGSPECSPLSCNSLAEHLATNQHCLLDTFSVAEKNIENGLFLQKGEPGPWRIFAVHSIESATVS